LARNHELLHNKTVDYFAQQLVLHFLFGILFMHKTYRPSIVSVVLQFKDLINENMKMSK